MLTGLVNVSIKTLEVGNAVAIGILTAYMLNVVGIAVVLYRRNINIKL